jgi:hypothetical protein
MSEYAGRIAVGALVAVALVVGLAFELNSYVPGTGTTSSSGTGSSSISPSPNYCGTPGFRVETSLQNGMVFLKVATDQGVNVGNGSVLVTHSVPALNGSSAPTTDSYCLRLDPFGSGELGLAANDSLPPTGSYNLTLIAGYDQGLGYQGIVPKFVVQPDMTVVVTVTVPSGGVNIATSAGNTTVTTTTSATSAGGASGPTTNSTSTSSGPPEDMLPGCNNLVGSVSRDGFQLNVYLESNSTTVGGNIIICTYFLNLSNDTATTYAANSVITITNSTGSVVAQPGCGGANTMGVPPGFACSVNWTTGILGTSKLAPGIAAGTYTLSVVVPLAPSSQEGYGTIEYTTTLTLTN